MKIKYYLLFGLIVFTGVRAVGQVEILPDTASSPQARYTFLFSEGLRTKMLGNPDEAISFFQKCIVLDPEKGAAYYELGSLHALKGDFAGATGYARNAWKRDNRNKYYGQLLIECLTRLGKPEECIPVYRILQENFPDEDGYKTGEIEVLIQAKRYKEAIGKLKTYGKSESLGRWSVLMQRDVYEMTDQLKKGIRVVEKWTGKHPDDTALRGVLAESYGVTGQKEKALKQYQLLKDQDPDNPTISFSLGQFYYQWGEKDKALDEFIKGFRSPDVNPAIKLEIVQQFIMDRQEQKKLDEHLIRLVEILYETDKGQPDVDALYANYLYSEGRNAEAEPIFSRLIRSNPGNYIVWQNLLFILSEKQDFERMYRVSDEAIKNFPAQGLFYLFKGIAATAGKNYPDAVAALNKGMTFPGQKPEVLKQFYISIGEALYKMGNTSEAFRNFDLLLGLEPDNALVLNNYSYYLSLENRELDKALEMIEKCIAAEKDNPTYLDTYAWVLFKKAEYQKALEPIRKVMELNRDPSGEVLEHYGDILFMNGMETEAREQWIKAREKGETTAEIGMKIERGLLKKPV